jgi:outer membrane receptor protein involved in Fe transport
MSASKIFKAALISTACVTALIGAAQARQFNIPGGDLEAALNAFSAQTGVQVLIAGEAVNGVRSKGVAGDLSADAALSRLLSGTGFSARKTSSGAVGIVRERSSSAQITAIELAQAAPARGAVETVTVTSSKLGGADVQSIPIAITALSQEQLTATQTAGGPDLVKQVPNLTFTKTNFTGYSIQIRGIGTQAISVTTDPAVAVAMNDQPFIRNHFFEQEFFDLGQVEVLRGPQGTLYGRNATAGVVNLTTAKPTDQFEAMASGEIGNYQQRRFEGMLNLPLVDDRLDVRFAGEWTKRQGYSFNDVTGQRIDGRDLWSGRATIALKPASNVQAYLIWEHFYENDDRIRSAKQLCKADPGDVPGLGSDPYSLSQGCLPASLYSDESFQFPNAFSLQYWGGTFARAGVAKGVDPYVNDRQSTNLRIIESQLDPEYKAKNDIVEMNVDYDVSPSLTFSSQTGFTHDFLWSTQDYNRFASLPNVLDPRNDIRPGLDAGGGTFCDPQLGCSNRLLAADLSQEHSWQLNQEFRLSTHLEGPLNFSVGANYLHYETEEDYFVFINTITLLSAWPTFGTNDRLPPWVPNVSDNHECLATAIGATPGLVYSDPRNGANVTCAYIDPNPIESLNKEGHNYFLSQNPYLVDSYAGFGEVYYNVTKDLKLTGGLRYTDDRKHFSLMPSWFAAGGYGYPVVGVVDQQWGRFSGRAGVNWTPQTDFTDQTLVYASYAHGYKAGGANPPGAVLLESGDSQPIHPLTFKPEYVDAFEAGTKNTLLDGALTINASGFYYDYTGYQISQIVDRTSVNLNFDARVSGAELEATWEPMPGLRFNFAGGYEHTALANGASAVDLMDRTAGNPDWVVKKGTITEASNCILPKYVAEITTGSSFQTPGEGWCTFAYLQHLDPVTGLPFKESPTESTGAFPLPSVPPGTYPGFDPVSPTAANNGAGPAPNNGAGFSKDLSGNELPNAPPFTLSAGAQYSIPLSSDWAGTLRGDFYWQDNSWWRVFNDLDYDRLHGYTNLNLTLILTNQNGWQVMLYDKNVFNTTAITGAFLNSDDSGLTTNVFLTDPKLIGVRVTKNW